MLGNDTKDVAKLQKVAQLAEDGSQKIGKKLSKEELKAGLNALWDDGGVEGALAAIERISQVGKKSYTVDPSMQAKDIENKVLIDGEYLKNPTAQNIRDLIKPDSRYIGSKKMNGRFMYVVDLDGNIIIGTRSHQHMPHPTLIGGRDPMVQGAGIIDIRGGKIYSIDNASGHFKPDKISLSSVQYAFEKLPSGVFHRDFQGYLEFIN